SGRDARGPVGQRHPPVRLARQGGPDRLRRGPVPGRAEPADPGRRDVRRAGLIWRHVVRRPAAGRLRRARDAAHLAASAEAPNAGPAPGAGGQEPVMTVRAAAVPRTPAQPGPVILTLERVTRAR